MPQMSNGKGKEKAESILAELKAGKDFSKMAKELSDDPSQEKGGDMGFIHKGGWSLILRMLPFP